MKIAQPNRRCVGGITIGLVAAYLWALLMFTFYAIREGWFGVGVFLVAGYAVIIASWFVVPIGALLGAILPRILNQRSQVEAIFLGSIAGLVCGLAAAIFTAAMELWPIITGTAQIVDSSAWMRHELSRFMRHAVSMGLVSALCVAAWAYIVIKNAEQGGAPNAHPGHAGVLARFARGIRRATGKRG